MLQENQEVALEAVGVPLDIQTDHMGPVKVILLVGQDGDNHLEQRCRGAAKARPSSLDTLKKDYLRKVQKLFCRFLCYRAAY